MSRQILLLSRKENKKKLVYICLCIIKDMFHEFLFSLAGPNTPAYTFVLLKNVFLTMLFSLLVVI
jgi:hypothetical protein